MERNQRLLYLGSSFSIRAHHLPRSAILALQSPLFAANGGSCRRQGGQTRVAEVEGIKYISSLDI